MKTYNTEKVWSDYEQLVTTEENIIRNYIFECRDLSRGENAYSIPVPNVAVHTAYWGEVTIYKVQLDEDCGVGYWARNVGTYIQFKMCAMDLMFGEISKIIAALQDKDDVLRHIGTERILQYILPMNIEDQPFYFQLNGKQCAVEAVGTSEEEDGGLVVRVRDINADPDATGEDSTLHKLDELEGFDVMNLAAHLNKLNLKDSGTYELLKKYVQAQGGQYTFTEPFSTELCDSGFDLKVKMIEYNEDNGYTLWLDGTCSEYLPDNVYVAEQDITSTNLDDILYTEFLKKENVMDYSNNHSGYLVDRINEEWKEDKESLRHILWAYYMRDKSEYIDEINEEEVLDYAHVILQDHCDDNDLRLILQFIDK